MKILQVQEVTKVYGTENSQVKACDHISFSVEQGEFIAIIGASGSGKSTLLHLMGGVDKLDSGHILVEGKDISNYSNDELSLYRRNKVGFIYQFYNLIPTLTVEENIGISIRLDGKKVNEKKLNDILDWVGLTHRKGHLPNQLSGGEQQRTSIARALINEPSIILADEPTGNLDTKSSDEIIAILKQSNKALNQTIILITHNPAIAKQCNRIIEIKDGKIMSDQRVRHEAI